MNDFPGESGALLRTKDWSKTWLGPSAAWPQSLRSALSLCLGSKFPLALYWGPKFCILYNDAWRPIAGARHPAAFGSAGRDVWPELWGELGPQFQSVLEGGPAIKTDRSLLVMHRNGYVEECYFDYQLSPVLGEGGKVDGVLNAVHETTFQVLAERRAKLLAELVTKLHGAPGVDDVFQRTAAVLEHSAHDVPYFALYRGSALVACSLNIAGTLAAPAELDAHTHWRKVAYPDRTHSPMPVVGDAWPEPVTQALQVPLRDGLLVIGISPRRALDDAYVQFGQRIADQLELGLASATAFEEQTKRAEALAAVDRAKTQFFANVSHEFRTPLTLMLGPTQDALAAPQKTLSGDQLLGVHRNQLRLLKLVNTLLDFSRIEAGRAQARYQPTDLGALTAMLASAFESLMLSAKLELVVDAKPLSQPVFVDRTMFEKVLLNLMSNAFKFTLEGRVTVRTREEAGHAVLEVEDTGTGIPAAELPNLFKRFHRVEGAKGRSYEGSGIGLALVHELVGLHGGTVAVQSTVGKGTRFTVSLPFGAAHLPKEHVDLTTDAFTEGAANAYVAEASQWLPGVDAKPPRPESASGSRVLLADDNREMREYVQSLLTEGGFQVEPVTDGQEALERAVANPPDLVISDVMMPRLDGFQLVKALRADARTRLVPVCLLSARAGDVEASEGIDAGADAYLVKPFSARELMSRVRGLMTAAASRREAQRVAEDERARMQALLEGVPASINFLRGEELVFEFAHPNTVRTSGRELKGRPLLEVMPEHRGQPYAALLRKVVATGEPVRGLEAPFVLEKDGQVEHSYWNYVYLPMRDRDGKVEGVMTFDIDVSDQVRARKKVEELLAELQDADRRKDEFLAMLGHELRNPMAAISIALSTIERSPGDAAKTSRNVERARRQMVNLTRLVDDLLDVARITRGKIDLKREPVELGALLTAAVSAVRSNIEAREHALAVEATAELLPVLGDSTRLEQIIVNLLTNAAKYTEPGGRITVTLKREGTEAVLRVKDTGRGIPPEMLEKVFETFVQVSPTIDRKTGGLGLGLTLVKRLVEMHHGRVNAKSEGEGHGSEFVVRLPLRAEAAGAAPRQSPPKVVAPLRILLVEDSEDLRDMLSELLRELGHSVEVAADGQAGMEAILASKPDLALVDVGLPKLDGFEVARRVRAQGGAGLWLVALTGYGGPEVGATATAAGFDAHLTKPLDVAELNKLIAKKTPSPLAGRGPG